MSMEENKEIALSLIEALNARDRLRAFPAPDWRPGYSSAPVARPEGAPCFLQPFIAWSEGARAAAEPKRRSRSARASARTRHTTACTSVPPPSLPSR